MDNNYDEIRLRIRNAAIIAAVILVGASLCFFFSAPVHSVIVIGSIVQALVVYAMKKNTFVLTLTGLLVLLLCSDHILIPWLVVPGELAIIQQVKFRIMTEWLAVITFYIASGVGIFGRTRNPSIRADDSGSKEF